MQRMYGENGDGTPNDWRDIPRKKVGQMSD